MQIQVNHEQRTIQPVDTEGDDHYGLRVGSNGTAAQMRRKLVGHEGYTWLRSNGKPAVGTTLIPSGSAAWVNPWDGPVVREAA